MLVWLAIYIMFYGSKNCRSVDQWIILYWYAYIKDKLCLFFFCRNIIIRYEHFIYHESCLNDVQQFSLNYQLVACKRTNSWISCISTGMQASVRIAVNWDDHKSIDRENTFWWVIMNKKEYMCIYANITGHIR